MGNIIKSLMIIMIIIVIMNLWLSNSISLW